MQQNNGDDDDWGEDFSEEAVKQRMEELSGAAKGLALTDDLEKTDKDRMDIIYKLVKVSCQVSFSVDYTMFRVDKKNILKKMKRACRLDFIFTTFFFFSNVWVTVFA